MCLTCKLTQKLTTNNLMFMRKGNWDFAKAVLMFFVIYGHVCPAFAIDSYTESWCALTRISGLFVMPLFFFISGYFQSAITDFDQLVQKFRRTFYRVVVPLMSWGGVYLIVKIGSIWNYSGNGSVLKYLLFFMRDAIIDVANFYWFFSALILCVLLGSLFSMLIHRKLRCGSFALILSLLIFTLFKVDLFHFTFVWFYYGCGMLYKFYEPKIKKLFDNRSLTLRISFATIFCLLSGCLFYPKYSFYYTSNLIWFTSVWFILFRYVLCLLASICVLFWIFKIYEINKDKPLTVYLENSGRDTLFLYCSHVLFLSCLVRPFVERIYGPFGMLSGWSLILYYLVSPLVATLIYYLLYLLSRYLKSFSLFRVLFMGLLVK